MTAFCTCGRALNTGYLCDHCHGLGSFTVPAYSGPSPDEIAFLQAVRLAIRGSTLLPHQISMLLHSLSIEAGMESCGGQSSAVAIPVTDNGGIVWTQRHDL